MVQDSEYSSAHMKQTVSALSPNTSGSMPDSSADSLPATDEISLKSEHVGTASDTSLTYNDTNFSYSSVNSQDISSSFQPNLPFGVLANKLLELQDHNQQPQIQQILPPVNFGPAGDLNFNASIGNQQGNINVNPSFWSTSNQHPSSGGEEYYPGYPGSVNGTYPFPNLTNPMFSANFYNSLAIGGQQHNRRSPGNLYSAQQFGTALRPSASVYPIKPFSGNNNLNNAWATSPHWNSLSNNPWNQINKRERPPSNFDAMRFSGIDSQLMDIMRTELPDMRMPGNTSKSPFFPNIDDYEERNRNEGLIPSLAGGLSRVGFSGERFSRKVFVGGLPPDIDEDEITVSFRRFGPLVVDWPHKVESKSYFPPKDVIHFPEFQNDVGSLGYAFLLFQDEASVQALIEACITDDGKMFLCVSSPTIKEKLVQIRPWNLADSDYVLDGTQPLDPRKTIFVGGVPRPLKARELAMIMDRLYGGVCYAGIDTDPELKYPKGAGRVAFASQQSYIAAISARFVQLQHADIDKRVEVKPYVLDDQMCDECHGTRCNGKYAPFFCASVTCLQYYCEQCWVVIHSRQGREFHKPLVKEGVDRSRTLSSYRW